MENATKALLMAGGVLIALLIISTLIFGYNKIVEYQNSDEEARIQQELAEFNAEYATYLRQDVTGFELVSLINKVIDYNHLIGSNYKAGEFKTDYKPMNISFTLKDTNAFKGVLFHTGNPAYEYGDIKENKNLSSKKTNDYIEGIMEAMTDLEDKYNASVLSKLAANIYSKLENGINDQTQKDKWKEAIDDILKYSLNSNPNKYPTRSQIQQYEEYISFKRSKFKYTNVTYDDAKGATGRITSITFVEI